MANVAWYGVLVTGTLYQAQEFLDVSSYKHVVRWATEILARPAVLRGQRVNRAWGPEEERAIERHSASDRGEGNQSFHCSAFRTIRPQPDRWDCCCLPGWCVRNRA